MNTIVTDSDKIFEFDNHLKFSNDITYDEWMAYGKKLAKRYSNIQWLIGDWINYGEAKWGEKYAQAEDDLSFSQGTLRNYASICARIPPENRNPKLRFHQIKHVAPLEPRQQRKIIDFASEHEMTGDDILEAVQRITKKETKLKSIEGFVMHEYDTRGGDYIVKIIVDKAGLDYLQEVYTVTIRAKD